MMKQPKPDRPKVQPLDPHEAALRFMKEATHDYMPALREIAEVLYRAVKRKEEGAAADKKTD
jgi:hypothetical protein